MTTLQRLAGIACCAALAFGPVTALAQPLPPPRSWPEEKCARYAQVWQEATRKLGLKGIGEEFRARHAAFVASGCQSAPDVCPRSKEELDLANVLILRGMSMKLASTFFPFRC